MSDLPLYFSSKAPTQINPAKIVPAILNNNHKKAVAQTSNDPLQFINPHQKKIAKDEKNKNKNYRTKMCPDGRDCKHRFRCNFAHTQQQLRKPFIRRKNPCILYQRGKCHLGSACRDYHGNMDLKKNYKYKKNICQDFLEGKCEKGEFCIHIHPEQQIDDPEEIEEMQQIEKEIEKKENEQRSEQIGPLNSAEKVKQDIKKEEEELDGMLQIAF